MRIVFENGQQASLHGNTLAIGPNIFNVEDCSTPVPGARFWYKLPGGAQRYIASKIKEIQK